MSEASTFIQWKGTDLCMDFYCSCGASCHFDGFMADEVQCPHCNQIWIMPTNIHPVKAEGEREAWRVQMLEPDEGFSDEVTGEGGVTRFVAHPVGPIGS